MCHQDGQLLPALTVSTSFIGNIAASSHTSALWQPNADRADDASAGASSHSGNSSLPSVPDAVFGEILQEMRMRPGSHLEAAQAGTDVSSSEHSSDQQQDMYEQEDRDHLQITYAGPSGTTRQPYNAALDAIQQGSASQRQALQQAVLQMQRQMSSAQSASNANAQAAMHASQALQQQAVSRNSICLIVISSL